MEKSNNGVFPSSFFHQKWKKKIIQGLRNASWIIHMMLYRIQGASPAHAAEAAVFSPLQNRCTSSHLPTLRRSCRFKGLQWVPPPLTHREPFHFVPSVLACFKGARLLLLLFSVPHRPRTLTLASLHDSLWHAARQIVSRYNIIFLDIIVLNSFAVLHLTVESWVNYLDVWFYCLAIIVIYLMIKCVWKRFFLLVHLIFTIMNFVNICLLRFSVIQVVLK